MYNLMAQKLNPHPASSAFLRTICCCYFYLYKLCFRFCLVQRPHLQIKYTQISSSTISITTFWRDQRKYGLNPIRYISCDIFGQSPIPQIESIRPTRLSNKSPEMGANQIQRNPNKTQSLLFRHPNISSKDFPSIFTSRFRFQ